MPDYAFICLKLSNAFLSQLSFPSSSSQLSRRPHYSLHPLCFSQLLLKLRTFFLRSYWEYCTVHKNVHSPGVCTDYSSYFISTHISLSMVLFPPYNRSLFPTWFLSFSFCHSIHLLLCCFYSPSVLDKTQARGKLIYLTMTLKKYV